MGMRSLGLALALALALPVSASAHDHVWPEAVLITETDSGAGVPYTASWSRRTGKLCSTLVADGLYGYEGPPVQWVPNTEMLVRFESRHRPSQVRAKAYLVGDPTIGTPIYGRVDIPHELRKVKVDGETRWEAVLSPPPWPDLYLQVDASWRDQDGCGGQHVAYTFRAGLLPI